jgi:hypothetical protein
MTGPRLGEPGCHGSTAEAVVVASRSPTRQDGSTPMRLPTRTCVAVAVALTSVFATIGVPASAEITGVRDRRGDNFTPGYDVTAARYANGERSVVSLAAMRRLRPDAVFEFLVSTPPEPGSFATTYAAVVAKRHGRVVSSLYLVALEGPGQHVRCPGLAHEWLPSRDRVAVSIPRRCLDLPTRRLAMETYVPCDGADTWSDKTRRQVLRRG